MSINPTCRTAQVSKRAKLSTMEDLPIDIHSSKLLDWLISRRHCQKDWQHKVYSIRENINHAIQDMPENEEIFQLLSGTYINYFHCKKIVEILKVTEKDSKNMFGSYSSQRMKDWQEIVKLYEKDNVFLAEAAQILQRLIQYEIPGIKKQIAKLLTTEQECEKKEGDYQKLTKEAVRNYDQECFKMGISNSRNAKIRTELRRLASDLPTFFTSIAEKSKSVNAARDYYEGFREYLVGDDVSSKPLLPVLSYVLKNGNVSYYQWRTGKVPERIEADKPDFMEEERNDGQEDEIDFGDDAELDFGIEVEAEVDYGEFEVVAEPGMESIENSSNSSADGGVARGDDALTLLEHSKTQWLFLQDLGELEAFLRIRLLELKTTQHADFLLASGAGDISSVAKDAALVGTNEVERYLSSVQTLIRELADPYKKHLYRIRISEPYLSKLTEEIEQKRALIDKNERATELMKQRQAESAEEAKGLKPKLDLLVEKTKELQKQVEGEISERYKGRRVNIMGGITAVLAGK